MDGFITAPNSMFIGGITGYIGYPDGGSILNSRNLCAISGSSYAGGIAGGSRAVNIQNCVNSGTITTSQGYVGGIVGRNYGTITGCVNNAAISGSQTSVGGIVGTQDYSSAAIVNCLNHGTISGTGPTGGICGYLYNGSVSNCFSDAATITAVKGTFSSYIYPARAGAIVGVNNNTTVTNCHYLASVVIKEGETASALAQVTAVGVRYKGKKEDAATNPSLETDAAGVTAKQTAEITASGKVARLLNGGNGSAEKADGAWGQLLKSDASPVLMAENKSNMVCTKTVIINGTLVYMSAYFNASTGDVEKSLVDGYFTIADAAELKLFRDIVNSGTTSLNGKLTADINLNGSESDQWTPIGNDTNKYDGIFDGGGFTVSGIYTSSDQDYRGFFGYINGANACVKNLTVDGSITAANSMFIGGITGYIGYPDGGSIINCVNRCAISGYAYAGGIAGGSGANVNIQNCIIFGTVTGPGGYVGGIVGRNSGTITGCVNNAAISGFRTSVGGIVGAQEGAATIANCLNHGTISGAGPTGGICGNLYAGSVSNCFSDAATITAVKGIYGSYIYPARAGAIVGTYYYGTVTNCHYPASVVIKEGETESTLAQVTTVGVRYKGRADDDATNPSLETDEAGVTTQQTAEVTASGKVARLLNGENGSAEKADGAWGQLLKTDASPTFMATDKSNMVLNATIYAASETGNDTYFNTGNTPVLATNAIAVINDITDASVTFGDNIVVKRADGNYDATSLVISDAQPFYTPVSFSATNATMAYTPATYLKSDYTGLETIVVPFTGDLYADNEVKAPGNWDTGNFVGDYMLSTFDTSANYASNIVMFKSRMGEIEAGVPYLLGLFGNDTQYDGKSLEGKSITVRGVNTIVKSTITPATGVTRTFTGAYTAVERKDVYELQGNVRGAFEGTVSTAATPFRAYFSGGDTTPKALEVRVADSPTGIDTQIYDALSVKAVNGELIIESPSEVRLPVFDFSGTLIRIIDVPTGKSVVSDIPKGIYIVNRTKVIL